MKKTILLTAKSVVRLGEKESLIALPEEKIIFQFNSLLYRDMDLKVTVKNNNRTATISLKQGEEFDLRKHLLLTAGLLEIEIQSIIKGEVVKAWEIAPITVKEIETHFEFKDLIKSLEERIKALEDQHKPIL